MPMRKNAKHIVRIDTRNTHGWQVRITRQHEKHTKFFSDSKHDGSDGAKAAAQEYRNNLLAQLPDPLPGAKIAAERRSTSGVAGIRLDKDVTGLEPIPRLVADAYNSETQTRKTRSWSLRKWDLRRALWSACTWKVQQHNPDGGTEAVQAMYNKAFPTIRTQLEGFGVTVEDGPMPTDEA